MKTIFFYLLVICLSCSLFGCGEVSLGDRLEISPISATKTLITTIKTDKLIEVESPQGIRELGKSLDKYQPQVTIVNPKQAKLYTTNKIEVQLKVKDLPIFKNEEFGLGSHLNLILDNEPDRAIYNLEKPLVLENLTPGTHTLRLFAASPWNESFKNEGAYAQTTFHILTKTDNKNPDSTLPLLTYSQPQGTYSAEPIMLDFYLNKTAQKNLANKNQDLFIRVTVNGESFIVDNWQSIYISGFKQGNNWVQLELLDGEGNQIDNVFNNTIRLITYNPENKDTLAKLTTGELSVAEVRGIVDRDYQPKTDSIPEAIETPVVKSQKEKLPKSSSREKETTLAKPKVNNTPSVVLKDLKPIQKEVVEIKEPTLEIVPIPDKSESEQKMETKEETLATPKAESKETIAQ